MAVSLATGIVFASVIILFLVPALLVISEELKERVVGRLDPTPPGEPGSA